MINKWLQINKCKLHYRCVLLVRLNAMIYKVNQWIFVFFFKDESVFLYLKVGKNEKKVVCSVSSSLLPIVYVKHCFCVVLHCNITFTW